MSQMNVLLQWLIGGFTSWKTSIAGVVGAIVVLLNSWGVIVITPEQQGTIIAFILLVIGWFAKDANKTGTPQEDS